MPIVFHITTFVLLGLAALVPIVAAAKTRSFSAGFWISQGINAGLVIVLAWWSHARLDLELWSLGYDAALLTFDEQLQNVAPEDLDRAQALISQGMGVGWPVHMIFGWPVMALYVCVAFFVVWKLRHR